MKLVSKGNAEVEALVAKVSVLLVSIRSAGEKCNSTVEFKPCLLLDLCCHYSISSNGTSLCLLLATLLIVPTLLATNFLIAPYRKAPPLLVPL